MSDSLPLYVVAYDISSDKLRTKLYQRLLDFGARLQGSVFECHLDHSGFNLLCAALEQLLDRHRTAQAATVPPALPLELAGSASGAGGHARDPSGKPDIASIVIYLVGADWERRRTVLGDPPPDTAPADMWIL